MLSHRRLIYWPFARLTRNTTDRIDQQTSVSACSGDGARLRQLNSSLITPPPLLSPFFSFPHHRWSIDPPHQHSPMSMTSTRAVLALYNDIKNRYIPLRPLIDHERDSDTTAWVLTRPPPADSEDTRTVQHRRGDAPAGPAASFPFSQRRTGTHRFPRWCAWWGHGRPRTHPRVRIQHNTHTHTHTHSDESQRTRTRRSTTDDHSRPPRGIPPASYASPPSSESHEAVPSYAIVIEEERRRLRSLRRRTLVDHYYPSSGTAGVWRSSRPRLPSAFFRPRVIISQV